MSQRLRILATGIGLAWAAGRSETLVNVLSKNFSGGAMIVYTPPVVFGDAIAPGGTGVVATGYFSGVSDEAIRSAGSGETGIWPAVVAGFRQFGESSAIGVGVAAPPGFPGYFSLAPGGQVRGTEFSGKAIYVVIGNGSSLLESDQMIVYRSPSFFADEPTPSVTANLFAGPPKGELPGELLLGTRLPAKVWYSSGQPVGQSLRAVAGAVVPEASSLSLIVTDSGIGRPAATPA